MVQESPPYEACSIIVTARRRTVEVDDLGVVLLPKRTWRRRSPERLNSDDPPRSFAAESAASSQRSCKTAGPVREFGSWEASVKT